MSTAIRTSIALLCFVLRFCLAAPVRPECMPLYLDVPVTGPMLQLDILSVDSSVDAVNFALDVDRWTSPNSTSRIVSSKNVTETFTIYAELCMPTIVGKAEAIQILTHGAIFDHRYWDATFDPEEYSYVKAALDSGYAVFNYDRICTGLSEKPDAYTICQAPMELEVLRVLTEMIGRGDLDSHLHAGSHLSRPIGPFETIIHVGHSFGSELTAALLTAYGNLSSAAILTGLVFATHTPQSATGNLGFEYAASNDPILFGHLGSGFIVPADVSKLQFNFFHRINETDPSGFTDSALAYGESIKQPMSVAEWISLRGLLNIETSPEFLGPLQFFVGEFDQLVCAGDCKNNYDVNSLKSIYPNASKADIYVQPGAGHGLTLHRNASAGYQVIMDFLGSSGS